MSTTLKVSRIGNSRGIRLPAVLLRKYHIGDSLILEEKTDEIVLRPVRQRRAKLSWSETAKAMAASEEDWSAWEATTADGLNGGVCSLRQIAAEIPTVIFPKVIARREVL